MTASAVSLSANRASSQSQQRGHWKSRPIRALKFDKRLRRRSVMLVVSRCTSASKAFSILMLGAPCCGRSKRTPSNVGSRLPEVWDLFPNDMHLQRCASGCPSDQSRCEETANEGFTIRVVNETYVCAIIRRQPRHSSRGDQNPTLANNDNQTASCIGIDRVCRSAVLPRATLLRVPRMSRDGR